jgi:dGTPase
MAKQGHVEMNSSSDRSIGITERARIWASTMQAHHAGAVRHAHRELGPAVEPIEVFDRLRREVREEEFLSQGATLSQGPGNRAVPEQPDPLRTCFERDRDRILHGATAFRRLAGKTQVFIFPDDHQRTRLTHALEVAQIAVAIARTLGLNEALTEAIALGHDCGHGPGGHASEDAFAPYLVEGFDHAVWGADVVLAHLNLCVETLDGIRNHSWSRPAPSTPEGEVVSWADRIAYVCHDFEDAISAGILTSDALPESVSQCCGSSRSSWIRCFVTGVVNGSVAAGHIAMTSEHAEALADFRALNYERIYLRPESVRQGRDVVKVLQALVEHFAANPDRLPRLTPAETPVADVSGSLHAAVSYVAGMTDRFACITAVRELNWNPDELPRGLDSRFAL